MTAIVTSQKIHTPQEYLALETAATTRHEYRNGEVLEITGGTPTHNEIIGAMTVLLRLALKRPSSASFCDGSTSLDS